MNNIDAQEGNKNRTTVPSTKPIEEPPKKPELKPFNQFIVEDLIPNLSKALADMGFPPNKLVLENGNRPVTGDQCWMVIGEIAQDRCFWLCFDTDKITSNKTVAISERGSIPTVLESFLIDEKKTTCALLISRLLQRLNGQKWLGAN